jgi:hypothetical protein
MILGKWCRYFAAIDQDLGMRRATPAVDRRGLSRESIALDFHRRQPDRVAGLLGQAGLVVSARLLREPDEDGNFTERTQQAFLLARKPAGAGP